MEINADLKNARLGLNFFIIFVIHNVREARLRLEFIVNDGIGDVLVMF